MGRVAYEMIRSWASVPIENNPVARFMNEVPKIVFSKSLKKAPWGRYEPARVVSNVEEEIKNQRKRMGKDSVVLGSSKLVQFLITHKLVDEYLFWVYPIAFGSGKHWSPSKDPVELKLKRANVFKSGIIELCYQPYRKA